MAAATDTLQFGRVRSRVIVSLPLQQPEYERGGTLISLQEALTLVWAAVALQAFSNAKRRRRAEICEMQKHANDNGSPKSGVMLWLWMVAFVLLPLTAVVLLWS